MRRLASVVVLALVAVSAHALNLNAAQSTRYYELTAELRCLICQNRSIAESDAPLAKDLRHIVARQIAAGQSDAEIKQYLVDRYGEWVLYDPPFKWSTWLLWLGPFALLILGLAVVAIIMRRRHGVEAAGTPALDRERLARVLAAEHDAGQPAAKKDRS